MSEETNEVREEMKVRSKTEEFKVVLQSRASEIMGTKVSKQKAWDLFKDLVKAPFSYLLANYEEAGSPEIVPGGKYKELELPLAGIGTFKIITVGKDDAFSVKGRWYISSAIDKAIKASLGFDDGEEEEETAEAESTESLDLEI